MTLVMDQHEIWRTLRAALRMNSLFIRRAVIRCKLELLQSETFHISVGLS